MNTKSRKNEPDIEELRHELQRIRKASLLATRQGDYRKVAKLTSEAAALNKAIIEAQGLSLLSVS